MAGWLLHSRHAVATHLAKLRNQRVHRIVLVSTRAPRSTRPERDAQGYVSWEYENILRSFPWPPSDGPAGLPYLPQPQNRRALAA
jgi:pimeloyl-ACP methyl ester carboxylesterase